MCISTPSSARSFLFTNSRNREEILKRPVFETFCNDFIIIFLNKKPLMGFSAHILKIKQFWSLPPFLHSFMSEGHMQCYIRLWISVFSNQEFSFKKFGMFLIIVYQVKLLINFKTQYKLYNSIILCITLNGNMFNIVLVIFLFLFIQLHV